MRTLLVLAGVVACNSSHGAPAEHPPSVAIAEIDPATVCATHGAVKVKTSGKSSGKPALEVRDATTRAFARTSKGDAAAIAFHYTGLKQEVRSLASGVARAQLGLKLRAQDSCNVIYVMWRTDKATLDVSVKYNASQHSNAECGTHGYRKIRPLASHRVPSLAAGSDHRLQAEIVDDNLTAWIDGNLVWTGTLPGVARELQGPVGIRSDNVELELELSASLATEPIARCVHDPIVDD